MCIRARYLLKIWGFACCGEINFEVWPNRFFSNNKIRGPERNFCQIRLVSGSLDRPCHDLYYTQLKCYRAVRASRDISHFVHFLRKKQLKKKLQLVGSFWNPVRYKCRNWTPLIAIPQKYYGKVASRDDSSKKVSGSREIAILQKSSFFFSGRKN